MTHPYHTARGETKNTIAGAAPTQYWTGPEGAAFVHDAAEPFPVEFQKADILYAEPAWRPGYDFFHQRAGVTPKLSWGAWMGALDANIRALGKPAIMACGKAAFRHINADRLQEMDLRKGEGWLAIYGDVGTIASFKDINIIKELAQRFATVGDFTCGYGRTGRAFVEAGGRFVMSDISAECIGYIAANAGSWA